MSDHDVPCRLRITYRPAAAAQVASYRVLAVRSAHRDEAISEAYDAARMVAVAASRRRNAREVAGPTEMRRAQWCFRRPALGNAAAPRPSDMAGANESVVEPDAIERDVAAVLRRWDCFLDRPLVPAVSLERLCAHLQPRTLATSAEVHAAACVCFAWMEAAAQSVLTTAHQQTPRAYIDLQEKSLLPAEFEDHAAAQAIFNELSGQWLRLRCGAVSGCRPAGIPLALIGTTKDVGHFERPEVEDHRRLHGINDGQQALRNEMRQYLSDALVSAGRDFVQRAAALVGVTADLPATSPALLPPASVVRRPPEECVQQAVDLVLRAAHRCCAQGASGGAAHCRLNPDEARAVISVLLQRCPEARLRLRTSAPEVTLEVALVDEHGAGDGDARGELGAAIAATRAAQSVGDVPASIQQQLASAPDGGAAGAQAARSVELCMLRDLLSPTVPPCMAALWGLVRSFERGSDAGGVLRYGRRDDEWGVEAVVNPATQPPDVDALVARCAPHGCSGVVTLRRNARGLVCFYLRRICGDEAPLPLSRAFAYDLLAGVSWRPPPRRAERRCRAFVSVVAAGSDSASDSDGGADEHLCHTPADGTLPRRARAESADSTPTRWPSRSLRRAPRLGDDVPLTDLAELQGHFRRAAAGVCPFRELLAYVADHSRAEQLARLQLYDLTIRYALEMHPARDRVVGCGVKGIDALACTPDQLRAAPDAPHQQLHALADGRVLCLVLRRTCGTTVPLPDLWLPDLL